MNLDYYRDAVVIITGAASGMGRELTLQAAARGASVMALDKDAEGLAKTAQRAAAAKRPIGTETIDLTDGNAIDVFAQATLPTLQGRRLILINNAGTALLSGNFDDTSVEDMQWLFEVNYWAPVRMCKAFYPYFREQNRGHIVNISSVFGLGGFPRQSAYSPSKFALRGLTEVLRIELLGTQVRTTVVHPGGIDTNIVRNARTSPKMTPAREVVVADFTRNARTKPRRAARLILNALPRNQQRLRVGGDAYLIDFIIRLLPVSYSRIFGEQAEKRFTNPYAVVEKERTA
jgi:NAD(P)-dependent dehydrogenase (short-subunit alcohol dehydrogenase family)